MSFQNDKINLFGTDGIRGQANDQNLNLDFAVSFGRALSKIVSATKKESQTEPIIIIGKDTRVSGSLFEYAIAAAICSTGIHVKTLGVLPTPAVAYLTKHLNATIGIMISASHNPYADNGIKLFNPDGFKPSLEFEKKLSALILSEKNQLNRAHSIETGTITLESKASEIYSAYIENQIARDFDLKGYRLVIDCANGASFKTGPAIFRNLGGTLFEIGTKPDGFNINESCGSVYPKYAAKLTLEQEADIGIALDGDGDRCILSDENGVLLDGDEILGICAIDMHQQGQLPKNSVVATVMSNRGLDLSLNQYGIDLIKTQVGDRQVAECMQTNNLSLGGEQSGHTIFMDHSTTGDGILSALKVLEIMKRNKVPLSQLRRSISLYPQVNLNVPVKRKEPFDSYSEINDAILNAKAQLNNNGRVFVRYSGTEPIARIMIEGEDLAHIQALSQTIALSFRQNLS